jgi:hypothetical protein
MVVHDISTTNLDMMALSFQKNGAALASTSNTNDGHPKLFLQLGHLKRWSRRQTRDANLTGQDTKSVERGGITTNDRLLFTHIQRIRPSCGL